MTDVNIKELKVVFVDWYKTLASMMFLNKLKFERFDLFQKIKDKIFDKNETCWYWDWARGELDMSDAAALVADDGSVSKEEVLKIFADCCAVQRVDTEEFWPVIEAIRAKGIKVVLATDNWDIFCKYTIPALNLYQRFDDILSSNEVGHIKRDIAGGRLLFFEDYMTRNQLNYNEVILIDDASVNCESCLSCGMSAKQVKSSRETLKFLKEIAEEC